jgi:hypothetical protein
MTSVHHRRSLTRTAWVQPFLNAAVVLVLVAPLAVAVGWTWVDALLDQF